MLDAEVSRATVDWLKQTNWRKNFQLFKSRILTFNSKPGTSRGRVLNLSGLINSTFSPEGGFYQGRNIITPAVSS